MLAVYITVPVVFALVMNGIIYSKQWNDNDNKNEKVNKYIPPGYIVGSIWVVIFGLLGAAMWITRADYISMYSIVVMIAFSLLYPVITRLSYGKLSVLMNRLTWILAFTLAIIITARNKYPFTGLWLLTPLLAWSSYVNVVDTF